MKSTREYSIYQFMLWLLSPIAKSTAKKMDAQFLRKNWHEKFGDYPSYRATEDQPIWIQAVSVGEVASAGVLMNELREQGYDGHFVVTTTTPIGADAIKPFLNEGDQQFYTPYDQKSVVNKALNTFKPRMLVVMEVEIWPSIWLECQARNIPVVMANALMSQHMLKKYQERMHKLWMETVSSAKAIYTQTEQIGERFKRLGANNEQIQIKGNLKFNHPVDKVCEDKLNSLKKVIGKGRPILFAAKTHAGEEYLVLEVHKRLLEDHPDLLLIMTPQHPHRFAEVASGCEANNPNLQVRSDDLNAPILVETQVYLADIEGELAELYSIADLCFVGGSFCNIGGHNIIEPATLGCPIVVGPETQNYSDVVDAFLDQGGLVQTKDAEEFYLVLRDLVASGEAREKLRAHANKALSLNEGAGRSQAEGIIQILNNA